MKILCEIDVKFDGKVPHIRELDEDEIEAAIASAVSGCEDFVNVASIEVKKVSILQF